MGLLERMIAAAGVDCRPACVRHRIAGWATALAAAVLLISSATAQDLAWPRLTSEQRVGIQTDLIWGGFYDGLVDGELGKGTISAIRQFQRGNGFDVTGVLTRSQWQLLAKKADENRRAADFQIISDDRVGVAIGIPKAYVQNRKVSARGYTYYSSDGDVEIDTIFFRDSEQSFDALFERIRRYGAIKTVGYSMKRGDRFVVSGEGEGERHYFLALRDGSATRAFSISYPEDGDSKWEVITVAMANTFRIGSVPSLTSIARSATRLYERNGDTTSGWPSQPDSYQFRRSNWQNLSLESFAGRYSPVTAHNDSWRTACGYGGYEFSNRVLFLEAKEDQTCAPKHISKYSSHWAIEAACGGEGERWVENWYLTTGHGYAMLVARERGGGYGNYVFARCDTQRFPAPIEYQLGEESRVPPWHQGGGGEYKAQSLTFVTDLAPDVKRVTYQRTAAPQLPSWGVAIVICRDRKAVVTEYDGVWEAERSTEQPFPNSGRTLALSDLWRDTCSRR